ncbi:hypothetical protein [Actinomadura sp. WMMB 499]|uniref:hypothetical protein n=1 Tax=Actinomadura sp. WMMB 499 TaxID=1219491 RepID=UPI0012463503|nr:hypothetical protein [Actinomadura sp. WMMB 499]QFG22309.1 hypothetical protein F7P10_15415 [Actinomadura sp. WMMB 499]
MTFIGFGRAFAVLISVTTFVFLFVHDSWRGDNLFLVPDLILCALLLIAAALPGRYAAPALGFALAMSAGVFTASVSSYAVRGNWAPPACSGSPAAPSWPRSCWPARPEAGRRTGHGGGDQALPGARAWSSASPAAQLASILRPSAVGESGGAV